MAEDTRARYIMIGGFLGAGKTTAVGQLARRLTARGVRWLVDVQNRDGGVPTFCRGWGKLPSIGALPT